MSNQAVREMTNLELAEMIFHQWAAQPDYEKVDEEMAKNLVLRIERQLSIKDSRIKHLEEKQEALYKKCCDYERRLGL